MTKHSIAFYNTKPYDRIWFDELNKTYGFDIRYYDHKLDKDTAVLADGCTVIVAFVNDAITEEVINVLYDHGVRLIALRSAGYNNVDFKAAFGKIHVVRVPAYSPYAVAEHAMALLLSLDRKIHHSYVRTREFNFSLKGLVGFDLHGKTAGVVGTGKIGRIFIDICKGFGMKVVAYDRYPAKDLDIEYVSFEELCKRADIISLHCPLTPETYHIVNKKTLAIMKPSALLVNTSRGALIDSDALLDAIKQRAIGGAALDVYEEEADFFYEDLSSTILPDDTLARLISMPNVIVTSHQAFLTDEALHNIAETTLENIHQFFQEIPLTHEICYQCLEMKDCPKDHKKNCF